MAGSRIVDQQRSGLAVTGYNELKNHRVTLPINVYISNPGIFKKNVITHLLKFLFQPSPAIFIYLGDCLHFCRCFTK